MEMAERGGFEPPEGCPSSVFKTDALNHSTISPHTNRKIKYSKNGKYQGACGKNGEISRKEARKSDWPEEDGTHSAGGTMVRF